MTEEIKKLGLNEYEARAYKSLLRMGKGSAVSVSKLSNIPRARVYDVLLSLEKKGFVLRGASKPIEFSVVEPMKAFSIIASRKKEELNKTLDEYKSIASELEKNLAFTAPLNEESAWIVSGRRNIYSKISDELDNCSETVLISSSEEGLKKKKGFFEKKLNSLSNKGVKVITNKRVDSRFIVFDKKSAMLFLQPYSSEEDNDKALFIKSPFIANYFHSNGKK